MTVEDFMKETAAAATEHSTKLEEESETKRQIHDLMENYESLKVCAASFLRQND